MKILYTFCLTTERKPVQKLFPYFVLDPSLRKLRKNKTVAMAATQQNKTKEVPQTTWLVLRVSN